MSASAHDVKRCSSDNRYSHVQRLTDENLQRRLAALLRDGDRLEADLIAHICEVDRRKLYRERGYSSMFSFCVEKLRLAEAVAYKRIAVARAVRAHPSLLETIASGDLHLTGVSMLAPHLTAGNVEELLTSAKGRSKRDIEKLLATRFPRPDVAAQIRRLPTRSRPSAANVASPKGSALLPISQPTETTAVATGCTTPSASHPPSSPSSPSSSSSQPSSSQPQQIAAPLSRRDQVSPLSAERFRVQFTADAVLHDRIREAQDLLGPRVEPGNLSVLFSKALEVLVRELKNKKHGVTARPRRQPAAPETRPQPAAGEAQGIGKVSRTIPRSVRRQVYERDGGQCAYLSHEGTRCGARWGLEYHHLHPYGRGGVATVHNLGLRCRSHNALAAEQDYGVETMAQRIDSGRRPRGKDSRGSTNATGCREPRAEYVTLGVGYRTRKTGSGASLEPHRQSEDKDRTSGSLVSLRAFRSDAPPKVCKAPGQNVPATWRTCAPRWANVRFFGRAAQPRVRRNRGELHGY